MRRKMNPKRLNISNGMRINAGKTKQSGPCIVVQGIVILIISIFCTVGIMQTDLHATNKVATSNTHTLAITTLNTVNCTGENATGECDVSSWVDIEQVAAGSFFSVALDVTGNVYCTGGMPFISDPCSESNSTFSGKTIVYIAAGETHIIGIDDNGKAYAVGGNNSGQTDISGWPSTIIQVDGGKEHTLGLKSDNKVVCAGSNTRNQCNVSSWTGITQISAGSFFSLGLKTVGTVEFAGWDNQNQASTISGWMNVKHISAGYDHSVAVTNANEPLAVGANEQGQCNTSNWTVIDDVVAGTTCTIGVLETGELTVIGDTESEVNDTEGWQLINNPPSPYTQASISAYEDYTAGPTCDLLNHANTTDLESDAEGKPISYYGTDLTASNGTVTYNGDSTFSYTPIADFNGSDSFTYTLTDGEAINPTGTASVSVWITPVNDPPYYSDFNSYSAIYFNYPATCLYDFDSIDLAGKAIKFSFWFNIPQTNSSDFQIHLTTDSGYFATNFRDSTSHHLTFFGNDTSITISENVWYKAVLLNENEVASFTLYDSNLNELSSKTRSHSYTNCCRIRVGASGGDSNLWQIIFDQLTLEVTETIDDVDVKYRKYFIDSTEWDNDFKNGSGGSFSLVDGLTEPNYMLDTVTEDAGPQSISAWARDLTAGAYNEGAQSLSITWTCSDESLFLTAPVISPVTSLSSDLTLTYAYKDDEYGPVTLTVVLYDDGGLDHLAYGAADRITRTYVIEALSVNDPPTFTFLRGTHITLLENSRIHTHAGAHSYTDWATSVYEGAIHETGQTLSFDVSNNNTGLFSIPPDMAVVSDTSYTRGELTFTLNADVSGDVTVTVILEDTGGTANSGEYQVTQTFTITILPDTDHDGPGGIGDTTGLAALKLWLKADSFTDLSDGATLTTWFDNTDNGYTCTQSGSPQYVENFSNDFPAVEFDGSNYFEYNASSLDFLNSTGISIFAVVNATTSGVTNTIIARDASGNHSWACQLDPSGKLLFSVANSSSQACTRLGASSISSNYTIVSFQYDGLVDESLQVYAGETDDSDSLGYTIPYYIDGSGPALRIGNDGNGNNFVGQIAELIVFNRALGDVERVLINNYLSSKYDIALSSNDYYTGDTNAAGNYDLDVIGIGQESDGSINAHAMSDALIVTNVGFLQDDGDYLLFGCNADSNALTVYNLPDEVYAAWNQRWKVHKTDISSNGGNIDFAFDLSLADMSDWTLSNDYVLLKRSGSSGTFESIHYTPTITNNQIIFSSVDTTDLDTGDCFTVGSLEDYALSFSGSEYLISEHAVALTDGLFTIAFWAKRSNIGEMYVVGHDAGSTYLKIGFSTSDNVTFGYNDSYTVSTSTSYTDTSNWHHYAFSYDGSSSVQLYIDGKLITNVSSAGSLSPEYTGTGNLYIAKAPGSSNMFEGELEQMSIWTTNQNQIEILEYMNSYFDGDSSNLLASWQFNEGAYTITYDQTSHVHDLFLTPTGNTPGWVSSTLAIGYSSTVQTERAGTVNFTNTNLELYYNYQNGASVVVTKGTTIPNDLPGAQNDFTSQYWVVARSSDSSFDANFSFTTDDDIIATNERRYKLFWRENGSTGAWAPIAYAKEVDTGSDTIQFNSIKTDGQFIISLDNFGSIAGAGYTLDFDGIDDCAFDETSRIDLTAYTSFTIEFWANRATDYTNHAIIGQGDTTNDLFIGFSSANAFQFSYDTSLVATGEYTETGWHHWAIAYDASTLSMTIYCDGEWITENTADTAYDVTGVFYIGCGPNFTDYFEGQIDEIRIWDTIRTQEEIQDNLYVPLQDLEADLASFWRMDEPWSYTYITDVISANSVHCEVTGSMAISDYIVSGAWQERTIDEDTSYSFVAGYDLENLDSFTIDSPGSPTGTSISSSPYMNYTPSANFCGTDTFTYTVNASDYQMTITVNPINDAPECGELTPTVIGKNQSGSLSFTVTDLESSADSLLITPTSNDYTLVSDSNIAVTCTSAGDCTATITPTTDEYGFLTITFLVSDPEGLTATDDLSLTINNYPSISLIADYTTNINTATNAIAFTISDEETSPTDMDLTLTSSPSGKIDIENVTFTKDGSGDCTLTLTPTTDQYGLVTVTVTVTDSASFTDTAIFDLFIKPVPEIVESIGDYITEVNTVLSISFTVTDVDSDLNSISLTITSSDTGILPASQTEITNNSGACTLTMSFTNTGGTAYLTITVTDSDGYTNTKSFSVFVNSWPTMSIINDATTSIDTATDPISFTISDGETESQDLTLTLSSSNLTLLTVSNTSFTQLSNGNCTVTLTPTTNEYGLVTIVVTVADNLSYTASESFHLTVTTIPEITTSLNDYTTSVDSIISIAFDITDTDTADLETLDLTLTSSNSDILPITQSELTNISGSCSLTLSFTDTSGYLSLTLTVVDIYGYSSSSSFSVFVNSSPSISTIDDYTTTMNNATEAIAFTICDGETVADELSLTLTSSNTGIVALSNVSFTQAANGDCAINLTPSTDQYGAVTIVVTVSDNVSYTEKTIFQLTIATVPEISSFDNYTTSVISAVSISYNVTDLDSSEDTLDLTITTSDNSKLTIDITQPDMAGAGEFKLTPTGSSGTVYITVTVTDIHGYSSSESFSLYINNWPNISQIENATTAINTASQAIAFTIADGEENSDALSLTLTSDSSVISTSNASFTRLGDSCTITLTPTTDEYGPVTIVVIVSDALLYSASSAFCLTVTTIPEIDSIANYTQSVNTTLSVPFHITDNDTADLETIDLTITASNSGSIERLYYNPFGTMADYKLHSSHPMESYSTATVENGTVAKITYNNTVNTGLISGPYFELEAGTEYTLKAELISASLTSNVRVWLCYDDENNRLDYFTGAFNVGDVQEVEITIPDLGSNQSKLFLHLGEFNQISAVWHITLIKKILPISQTNLSNTSGSCSASLTFTDISGPVAVTLTVTDAYGYSSSTSFSVFVNENPSISSIDNNQTLENTAITAIPFTVSDGETTDASELSLTITSSNTNIITLSNASFTQLTTGDCTLSLTPTTDQYGAVTIVVIVSDNASYTAPSSFVLTVTTSPEIESIDNYTTTVNTAIPISFNVTDMVDTAAGNLSLTISTSDSNILPVTTATLTNTAGNCVATLTPTSTGGTATITITVTDSDGYSAFTSFLLNVINEYPEISSISDCTSIVNSDVSSITFIVSDTETAAQNLDVTVTTSNSTILPETQITLNPDTSNYTTYTMTISPSANETGSVTITVIVTDGGGYTNSVSFSLDIDTMPGSGNMLTFNGSSDYAKSGDTLSLSDDHTVEAWIKTTANSGSILSIGKGNGKYSKILLDSGKIAVDLLNAGGVLKSYTGSTVNDDEWYHIAYTYQSSSESLTIYVNGIELSPTVGEDQAISPFTLSSVPIYIGKDQGSSYFDGSIDEVRIWNDVRTEEEIRDFMCEKAYTSPTDDLVAYYRFDHDSGITLMYDWTGSGNSCDLTGATLATSEAPIGDDSVHDYVGSDFSDFTASLAHSDGDTFTITASSGTLPDGIHLYIVTQTPNSTNKDSNGVEIRSDRYWGLYSVGTSVLFYNVKYYYEDNPGKDSVWQKNAMDRRDNNADSSWSFISNSHQQEPLSFIIDVNVSYYIQEFILLLLD
jgi:alpha-tubulin suppressor-like RCC1 family protein